MNVSASLVIACVVLANGAQAQTRSTLIGTVTDGAGTPVRGATLTLQSEELGATYSTAATARGTYRFAGLLPGVYDLTGSFSGQQTVKRTGLRVAIGSTLTVDLVLRRAETPGVLTIDGGSPLVDVTTAASTTRLTKEDLENLPVDGSTSILQVAPGVTVRTAFGSSSNTDALIVDGGAATHFQRNNARSAAIHPYWMAEAQIAGLGASAEQGEFSGALANVALRSGTRRFSGLVEHRISPSGWVDDNTEGLRDELRSAFRPQEILSRWNSHAWIGGPVKHDRLFFFTGVDYLRNKEVQAGVSANVPFDERTPTVVAKLTWTLSKKLTVNGFVESDKNRQLGALGRDASPEVANDRWFRIRSGQARAVFSVNPHAMLEFRTSAVMFTMEGIPAARRLGPPPRRDRIKNFRSGNVQQFQDQSGGRYQTGATLTHFLDGFGGLGHALEYGVEIERTTYANSSGTPGGRSFTDVLGVPETVELWPGDRVRGRGTRTTFFVQDGWSFANRVTLHPGARLSVNRGSVPDQGTVFRTAPLSPHIGVAWDVSADHRAVVRASYGRIHEGLYTGLFDFMNTADRHPKIRAKVIDEATETFEELSRTAVSGSVDVDDKLAHSYVDQYLVGAERQVLADISVVVQYVRRNFGDIWALTDTGSQYAAMQGRDPGPDATLNTNDDGPLVTVYDQLNPGHSFTVLTNPPDAYRTYDAFQVIAQKRFSNNWQALGAYTWSNTRGTVGASAGDNRAAGPDTGADGMFFNPNRRINASGPASFDYRHQVNLQGVYVMPAWGGMALSATYRFLSGGAASRTAVIAGPRQGNQTVRIDPRGTIRLDAASALDMRVEKTIPVGRSRTRLGLYVELLNVTNQGVPFGLLVTEQSGQTFGEPTSWADPRTARIGGRLRF